LACYADHPLVAALQARLVGMPVVGIFEASVHHALAVLQPLKRFAILTTGKAYEEQLHKGVMKLLDIKRVSPSRFAGVVSTGVGFSDVEKGLEENVKAKIRDAVTKLLGMRDIGVICLGGVMLFGTEKWIRETCEAEMGQEAGQKVMIVDQLEAGVIAAEEAMHEASCR
jgi:Asp/Glu/hydantoin racemase